MLPSSLKIPFIFNITLGKKKICSFKQSLFMTKKEKNYNCAGDLSRQVQAEAYWLFLVFFSPTSAPEHVCFNLTILSQGKKQKQCQRSGLAMVFPHNWNDFPVNHPSHEPKYPSPAWKVGRQKERQSIPCYCLSQWKHFVFVLKCSVTVGKEFLFLHRGFMCYSIHIVHFSCHWHRGKLHIDNFGEDFHYCHCASCI